MTRNPCPHSGYAVMVTANSIAIVYTVEAESPAKAAKIVRNHLRNTPGIDHRTVTVKVCRATPAPREILTGYV